MKASGSRSTTSYLSCRRLAAICAPVASEMSRSAEAPPVRTPTRIFFTRSPFADELDLRHELYPEALGDLVLANGHELTDIGRARVTDVDDEVRVLLAHHRATDPPALEPGGLDEPTGVIGRRVAKDGPRIGLRERLLLDALVRHLLDPAHRGRAVAGLAAEAGAHAHNRRSLER